MNPLRALPVLALAAAASAGAQTIELGELPCLPSGENSVLTVRVEPPPAAEMKVRLQFRRLHQEVEDFYFTEMVPTGGGAYWGVFPQPEATDLKRQELEEPKDDATATAEWWRAKELSDDRDPNDDLDDATIRERASHGKAEPRDWLRDQEDDALERFLVRQDLEPAEYFVSLVTPEGAEVARTEQSVVEVRDDCRAALTPQQLGLAQNLIVGETAPWQAGEPVFHWECTGIVTRLDPQRVLRPDEACRACVVAWWPIVGGAAAGAIGVVAVTDDDPPPGEVSPSRP